MLATAIHSRESQVGRFAPAPFVVRRIAGGDLADFDRVGTIVSVARNEALFREGDSADYCFKVLAGAVRSCRLLSDGRRHISGFALPGDFIGAETEDAYRFTAEAVSDVTLMRYSRQAIDRLVQQQPGLGKCLLRLVCGDLSAAQSQMLLLGRKNAVERLASFLLMMAHRNGDIDRFALPMTRGDIADYLGLTTETVSRIFGQFKSQGIISFRASSEVGLKNRDALQALSEAA
jgi:CRP-like cAMP-binding protein